MPVNRDKPDRWKQDVAESVDLYNEWFLRFAPKTFRDTRVKTTEEVQSAFKRTDYLRHVTPEFLREQPGVLFALRMSTAPPIARDRLVGLAKVNKSLVLKMEANLLPPKMSQPRLHEELARICLIITRLADEDIFAWLGEKRDPTEQEVYRAATIVADRLCGAQSNPIIRNAQEERQLRLISDWLNGRGYRDVTGQGIAFSDMPRGTFAIHLNVPGVKENDKIVNIPVDMVINPFQTADFPLLVEAKSAGDFTNTNKRRKEEAVKMADLRRNYGKDVPYILFLCGYFDAPYLGYEAAEGIDWVWEHRIDDLAEFGI